MINSVVPRGSIFQMYYEDEAFKFSIQKPIKKTGLLKEV
jgi:hypothetical protein